MHLDYDVRERTVALDGHLLPADNIKNPPELSVSTEDGAVLVLTFAVDSFRFTDASGKVFEWDSKVKQFKQTYEKKEES